MVVVERISFGEVGTVTLTGELFMIALKKIALQ